MSTTEGRRAPKRHAVLPPNLPPRIVSREEAAAYVCLGDTKFDLLVRDGTLPQPKMLGGRKVWDVRALDRAIDAIPDATPVNPWD
jgi:predicted DNA-binding transcriptional regulator AlpA